MEVKVYELNAFSQELSGGNPAGVVLDGKGLTEEEMQSIAREINLSETAFVDRVNEEYFKVRFFTPACEVDLCGHATIATFYLLGKEGHIKPGKGNKKKVYQETKAGKLEVELVFKDGNIDTVLMEQSTPERFEAIEDLERLGRIMGIEVEDIGIGNKEVNPEIISTGLKDIILPVKTKEILDNLEINMEELSKYSKELDVVGVHAFYLPELNGGKVYTRNFAPAVGIDEESATGTSNGALIYFLKDNGYIEGNDIVAYQGEGMGRPSKIHCNITEENGKYLVRVGGKGVVTNSKTIKV